MKLIINNWSLQKADKADDDKYVYVRIIANRLVRDRENQEILPQAFNKATIKQFLDEGIIDWHHQSVLGRTNEERAGAILGKPYDFRWENGLPVVYAKLTKAHPIVKNSILPHLEAEQSVFCGSVGGKIQGLKKTFDPNINDVKDQIYKIGWNHLAIAAAPYVISPGSQVSLVKAENDIVVEFSDVSAFEKNPGYIYRETELRKALEMGYGTDIAGYQGGDAIREQSLEGDREKDRAYKALVDKVIVALIGGEISPSRHGLVSYLRENNIPDNDIGLFCDRFYKSIRNMVAQL